MVSEVSDETAVSIELSSNILMLKRFGSVNSSDPNLDEYYSQFGSVNSSDPNLDEYYSLIQIWIMFWSTVGVVWGRTALNLDFWITVRDALIKP